MAILLLALGIKGLSKVRSAREANRLAAIAMILAVVAVLVDFLGSSGISFYAWTWIIVGGLVGGLLGMVTAQKVPMTAMPELVAGFHSLVGLAAVFVAIAAFLNPSAFNLGSIAAKVLNSKLS